MHGNRAQMIIGSSAAYYPGYVLPCEGLQGFAAPPVAEQKGNPVRGRKFWSSSKPPFRIKRVKHLIISFFYYFFLKTFPEDSLIMFCMVIVIFSAESRTSSCCFSQISLSWGPVPAFLSVEAGFFGI